MQTIKPSNQSFRGNLNSYPWQTWVEGTCVAGSAVGTVVAAISGQVVYAAVPLTLALSLNLSNRMRSQQETAQQTTSAIADVRQRVDSLQTAISQQPPVEKVNLHPLHEAISQLQTITQRLQKTAVREDDWETVNVRLLLMQEQLDQLSTPPQAQSQFLNSPETEETLPPPPHLAEFQFQIQTEMEPLARRVKTLEQQNKQIVKPYLQRLTQAVKKLEQTSSLTALKRHLDRLQAEFQQQHPESEEITALQREMTRISEGLAQLQQRFETLPPWSNLQQLGSREAPIRELFEKVSTLNAQMQRRLNCLENEEVERLHQEIEFQATTIASLQDGYDRLSHSVTDLSSRLETLPHTAPREYEHF
ncbi:hypothetical protein [Laspinema olomoucense]|uniref:hypothetical protein n=1 Tax=Laspinema olomoucense TaxID=3231600 RepID=UPI0021BAD41B|nr:MULTISPECIES: hypothetical protein [unclassified Laspinema]MCT7973721.1 hypothetical protein [Laspinema sp. D3d]MCT7995179.1 hypothetical protein [Laspinema sp. D3c]